MNSISANGGITPALPAQAPALPAKPPADKPAAQGLHAKPPLPSDVTLAAPGWEKVVAALADPQPVLHAFHAGDAHPELVAPLSGEVPVARPNFTALHPELDVAGAAHSADLAARLGAASGAHPTASLHASAAWPPASCGAMLAGLEGRLPPGITASLGASGQTVEFAFNGARIGVASLGQDGSGVHFSLYRGLGAPGGQNVNDSIAQLRELLHAPLPAPAPPSVPEPPVATRPATPTSVPPPVQPAPRPPSGACNQLLADLQGHLPTGITGSLGPDGQSIQFSYHGQSIGIASESQDGTHFQFSRFRSMVTSAPGENVNDSLNQLEAQVRQARPSHPARS
jgi:hypothetical protein